MIDNINNYFRAPDDRQAAQYLRSFFSLTRSREYAEIDVALFLQAMYDENSRELINEILVMMLDW